MAKNLMTNRVCNSSKFTVLFQVWSQPGTGSLHQVIPPKNSDHCNAAGFTINTRHFRFTTLHAIKYLCSDRIMRWAIHRLCRIRCDFTSCFRNCDLTNIGSVAIENPRISHRISRHFTQIHGTLVAFPMWMGEVKEVARLHNLGIDHLMIWSELINLIATNVLPKL